MNKYSLFMIIFIIINPIFSLKTEDLCIKNNKCKGKYGYDCGSKYCALSKQKCTDFYSLSSFLVTLKGNLLKQKITNTINTITKCPVVNYEWKSTDICLNVVNCQTRKSLIHLLGKANINFVKHMTCVCAGNYKLQCDKKYCALNQDACDEFQDLVENSVPIRLSTCGNNQF